MNLSISPVVTGFKKIPSFSKNENNKGISSLNLDPIVENLIPKRESSFRRQVILYIMNVMGANSNEKITVNLLNKAVQYDMDKISSQIGETTDDNVCLFLFRKLKDFRLRENKHFLSGFSAYKGVRF